MKYKLSVILDLAQRAFGTGASKEMKPIKWLVDAEQLHKFMECVLEDHGIVEKKPNQTTSLAMKQAREMAEDDFRFLKKAKKTKKAKTKRSRK